MKRSRYGIIRRDWSFFEGAEETGDWRIFVRCSLEKDEWKK